MHKTMTRFFCALALGTAAAGTAFAYPGISSGDSSGSYYGGGSDYPPAPNHGSTDVSVNGVSIKCTNPDAVSFGAGAADRPDSYGIDTHRSSSIGVVYSHVFNTNSAACKSLAATAQHQARMSASLQWIDTVRQTCREDLAADLTNIQVLEYYKALTQLTFGHEDLDKARHSADMCAAMRKGPVTGTLTPAAPQKRY
ncbi:MAG: hypothetical protein H6867_11320 [Rhodospirillales bacterium]|nr:hypothetical protein [Rhodospirillales bacterium]MCB9996719.1 hypothetical protein [Rhodospirillales bacterium]